MVSECPFCRIVEGNDSQAREVYRDEDVVAFLPNEPATRGHLLVVPRKHVEDIWALAASDAAPIARAVVHLASVVRDVVQPQGLNIVQSNGSAATQTVEHLHVHIVPRWHTDGIGDFWPDHAALDNDEKDEVQERLHAAAQRQGSA